MAVFYRGSRESGDPFLEWRARSARRAKKYSERRTQYTVNFFLTDLLTY